MLRDPFMRTNASTWYQAGATDCKDSTVINYKLPAAVGKLRKRGPEPRSLDLPVSLIPMAGNSLNIKKELVIQRPHTKCPTENSRAFLPTTLPPPPSPPQIKHHLGPAGQ